MLLHWKLWVAHLALNAHFCPDDLEIDRKAKEAKIEAEKFTSLVTVRMWRQRTFFLTRDLMFT